jgi:hypothetical protein
MLVILKWLYSHLGQNRGRGGVKQTCFCRNVDQSKLKDIIHLLQAFGGNNVHQSFDLSNYIIILEEQEFFDTIFNYLQTNLWLHLNL